MKRTYSEAQINYMQATAIVESLRKQADDFNRTNAPDTEDEPTVTAYLEASDRYMQDIGYWTALDLLRQAEAELFAWASATIKADPKLGKRYAEIAPAFERGAVSPKFRPQLVEICMRFAA